MNRPKDWDNVREYEKLDAGGYVLRIVQAKEMVSQAGNPMLVLLFDIAEGEESGYFKRQFDADTRDNKKWRGTYYQLTQDKDGNTPINFKRLIGAIERSNVNFDGEAIWGDGFCDALRGKIIGGVFREEQYEKQDRSLGWSTKCYRLIDADKVREGVEVPEKKYLERKADDFVDVGFDADNDDLPF